MADTRGIRELAEQFWDSPEGQFLLKSIELPMDTTEQQDDRLIGTTFAAAFAESIVEQCCKVEIQHVDIPRAPERWDVLVNGKRVHYFGYEHEAKELKENIESAICSRWQRGEGK